MIERRIEELVNAGEMQFSFMSGRGTTVALLSCEEGNRNIEIREKNCGY